MLDTATQNSSGIIDTLVKIGSLLGSIAFVYTLRLNARNAPKFDFDFGSFSGINKMPSSDGKVHFSCTFKGFIVNKSNENNYIKKIYLVVWKNRKKRDSTLRFGMEITKYLIEKQKENYYCHFHSNQKKQNILKLLSGNKLLELVMKI